MRQIITKKELGKLMKIEGEGRGVLFKTASKFILEEEGKEGLRKFENVLANLDYPIKLKKIRAMDFYPVGMYVAMLVATKRIFNFKDEKFIEMGRFESKISIIIRLFARYFFSIDTAVKQVQKIWSTYFTKGDITVTELDLDKKYGVFRVENFNLHPLHCLVLVGYFPSVVQMVVGSESTCQERKCVHRGDDYHEYLLKW